MDPLTAVITIIGVLAAIMGIPAAVAQILQYRQDQRDRKLRAEYSPTVPPATAPPVVKPNNMPSRGEFIGRQAEKERVKEALASRWPLICIDGIGGIGKTSLALEVVGECLQISKDEEAPADALKFDGFIWTSARDRELTLNDVLDTIARTLDYPGIAQQPLEEKREAMRKLLQTKRYLLVVDNFETITDDAVRGFLLALPEPTKALVTSRTQDLRQAWSVSLKGMEQVEALTLMRNEGHRLGLVSIEAAPEQDLLRVYQGTGGAPLAMKWAIGQIKQKGQSLDTVLAYLYDARGDIFESIFARSWDLMGEDARRVLMVMPIFVTSASKNSIEATSDVHRWELDEALGLLVQLWLVEASEQLEGHERRYSIHPLTRAFAKNKSEAKPDFMQQARQRNAVWLADFAKDRGDIKPATHEQLETELPSIIVGAVEQRTHQIAYVQLETELPNIIASMRWCHIQGIWQPQVDCGTALRDFLQDRGYWDEGLELGGYAIQAAQATGDLFSQARICVNPMGWVYRHRWELEKAKGWYERGIAIYLALGEQDRVAWARLALANIAFRLGDTEGAKSMVDEVRNVYSARDEKKHRILFAMALIHLSGMTLDQGEPSSAEKLARDAWQVAKDTDSEKTLMMALYCLGMAEIRQNRFDSAEEHLTESLAANVKRGIRMGIAICQAGLAEVNDRKGQTTSALEYAKAAADLFIRLGMRRELAELEPLLERLQKNSEEGIVSDSRQDLG